MADLVAVSWGRATSGSLSAQVVSTRAHLVDPEADWKTLCGVDVPFVARPSTPRGQRNGGVMSRVWRDTEAETAQQARCQRCERKGGVSPG